METLLYILGIVLIIALILCVIGGVFAAILWSIKEFFIPTYTEIAKFMKERKKIL